MKPRADTETHAPSFDAGPARVGVYASAMAKRLRLSP